MRFARLLLLGCSLLSGGCVHMLQGPLDRALPPTTPAVGQLGSIDRSRCSLEQLGDANAGATVSRTFIQGLLGIVLAEPLPLPLMANPEHKLKRSPEVLGLGITLETQAIVVRIRLSAETESNVRAVVGARLHFIPEIETSPGRNTAVLRLRPIASLVRLEEIDLSNSEYSRWQIVAGNEVLRGIVNSAIATALGAVNSQITPLEVPLEFAAVDPSKMIDGGIVDGTTSVVPYVERASTKAEGESIEVLARIRWMSLEDFKKLPDVGSCSPRPVGRVPNDAVELAFAEYADAFKGSFATAVPSGSLGIAAAWAEKRFLAEGVRKAVGQRSISVDYKGPLPEPLGSAKECETNPAACDVIWRNPSVGFLCDWFDALNCQKSESCTDFIRGGISGKIELLRSAVAIAKAEWDRRTGGILDACCNLCGCDGRGNCGGNDLEKAACATCMGLTGICASLWQVQQAYDLWQAAVAELNRWEGYLNDTSDRFLGGVAKELGWSEQYDRVCAFANTYMSPTGLCAEYKDELSKACRSIAQRVQQGVPFDCKATFGQNAQICDRAGDTITVPPNPITILDGKKIGSFSYEVTGVGDDAIRAKGTFSSITVDDALENVSVRIDKAKGSFTFDASFDFRPEPVLLPICPNECYPEFHGNTVKWTCVDSGLGLNRPVYKGITAEATVPAQDVRASLNWEMIGGKRKLVLNVNKFDVKLMQPARLIRCLLGGNCGGAIPDPAFIIRLPCALTTAIWSTADFIHLLAVGIDSIDEAVPALGEISVPWKDNPKLPLLDARSETIIDYAWVPDPVTGVYTPTEKLKIPIDLEFRDRWIVASIPALPADPARPPNLPDFPRKRELTLRFGLASGVVLTKVPTSTPDEHGRGFLGINPFVQLAWDDGRWGAMLGPAIGPGLDSTGVMAALTFRPWSKVRSDSDLVRGVLAYPGSKLGFFVGGRQSTGGRSVADHGIHAVAGLTWDLGGLCIRGCI